MGLAGVSSLDDSIDVTSFKLRISNIIVLLLHRDPLGSNIQAEQTHEMSLEELNAHFFRNVNQHSKQNLFGINEKDVREKLVSICCYDHLRSVFNPLSANPTKCSNTLNTPANCRRVVSVCLTIL